MVLLRQHNEIGYTLCRTQGGKLMRGPIAEGSSSAVRVRMACPPGTQLEGLFHTHPGGVARPSAVDMATARRVGAKIMCIDADGELRCFRPRRR